MKNNKDKEIDVVGKLKSALTRHELFITFERGRTVARIQLTEHKSPVYYNRKFDSDTRYAHRVRKVGVLYVAVSQELAIAESFQGGQNASVSVKELEARSLHQLKVMRELKLVNAGSLAAFAGLKPRDLVAAKGQGSEGYLVTQMISTTCMVHGLEIDGLMYSSSVYSPAGTEVGCNVVLFEGRGFQVEADGATPLMEAMLPSGKTAIEFLCDLGLSVE